MTKRHREKPDVLWYTRSPVPTPLGFAIQFGWIDEEFAPDGILIKSLRESSKSSEQASHYDHSLPNSFRQGGNVPPIWARANGQETRVIGLTWTDEYQAIISLPKSGIRKVKDLRGRKVGIPKHEDGSIDFNRASAIRAFLVALESEGFGLDDIELVDLPTSTYITVNEVSRPGSLGSARHSYVSEVYALVRGEVDAVYVKDVRGAEIAHLLAAHVVFDLGFHPDPYIRISNCAPRPLTVNAETIEHHPDLVVRFLRRVVEAGEWAKTHPAESITWIGRETGWSEAWVSKVFGPNVHQHLGIDLAEDSVKGLDTIKNFLFEYGFLKHDFDTRQWIDSRPLEALRSEAKKIA